MGQAGQLLGSCEPNRAGDVGEEDKEGQSAKVH